MDSSKNPYLIAYSAQSIPPVYEGGDYNNVPFTNTEDSLEGESWNNFKYSNVSAAKPDRSVSILSTKKDTGAPEASVGTTSELSKVNEEYDNNKTKDDLTADKNKVHEKLNKKVKANGAEKARFTATFAKPVPAEKINEVLAIKNLKAKVVYARGINREGLRVTIATSDLSQESLNQIINDKKYTFKGFTEIEGEGNVADLINVQNDSDVFAVE
ncbi:hypothetical protein CBW46_013420 [Paenibacillus xerothermodurans]|uniref:Uncharacterized protein n=2 Tax=Paenibacillus xerothermodurans TaxID=1977292 RepID=A0A2W1NZX0_PAEXE|nr:hypothetical protein CBW46_013420 [Paenibacillus xerothermodurans]